MLYASGPFGQKATVDNNGKEFIVLGEEPLTSRIRLLLLRNDPFALHLGTILENVAAVLKTGGIDSELDENSKTQGGIPEGAVF